MAARCHIGKLLMARRVSIEINTNFMICMATTKSQVGLWLVRGWGLLEIQVTTSGHGPLQDCRLYKHY